MEDTAVPGGLTHILMCSSPARRPRGSMCPDSISQAYERVCKAVGIEGLTLPHDLRHEAASRLGGRALSGSEVASITGHKATQMVKRYMHFRTKDFVGRLG